MPLFHTQRAACVPPPRPGLMHISGQSEGTCFLDVVAYVKVEAPIDAVYLGPVWPKWRACALTDERVARGLQSPCLGGAAAGVLAQWSAAYEFQHMQNGLPCSCLQQPAYIAKCISE
eukprot:3623365-Alexandrium_andersonii.AAC.1